jgi:thiamine biosynthesis lipoprotein
MEGMREKRFRAMGSDCHLVIVGGAPDALDAGRARVDQLEQRWSRFLPGSEISRLNALAGHAVAVSADTVALVERAVEAWRFTGGTFDPTVLGDMLRAGYDRTFDEVRERPGSGVSDLFVACTDIEIDGDAVRLPEGTGFDPGGIGKGLAADLVVTELMQSGADGVCMNMGGDVRVAGVGPDGASWTVGVEHPRVAVPLVVVGVANGAVATSTTLRRRWEVDGEPRHHLIDPRTGEPALTDLELVTVIGGEAWSAEVLAKAVLIRGGAHPFDLVEGTGAHALVVADDGVVRVSAGFASFVVGSLIPDHLPTPSRGT